MRLVDREKQRQEYVKKKAITKSTVVANRLIFYFVWIGTAVCFLFTFYILYMTITHRAWPVLIGVYILARLTFRLTQACKICREHVEQTIQQDKSVRYVPPVNLDTLTADEVLVRGSEMPIQEQINKLIREADENAVLLRAAESAETPAAELLRASTEE